MDAMDAMDAVSRRESNRGGSVKPASGGVDRSSVRRVTEFTVLTLIVLLLATQAGAVVQADLAPAPGLTLAPREGPVGTRVMASGAADCEDLHLTVSAPARGIALVLQDVRVSDGSYETLFKVPRGGNPDGTSPDELVARVWCQESGQPTSETAEATFQVVGSPVPASPGRLAGPDRIATAVQISRARFPEPAAVNVTYIARADAFADALAGGILADGPILLVPSCGELPIEVVEELQRIQPAYVVALGGETAVCEAILQQAVTATAAE